MRWRAKGLEFSNYFGLSMVIFINVWVIFINNKEEICKINPKYKHGVVNLIKSTKAGNRNHHTNTLYFFKTKIYHPYMFNN